MALFGGRKEKRWRERVAAELVSNLAWRQYLNSKDWICPYCGKMAVEAGKDDPELADRVMEHLKGCPDWQEFEGHEHPYQEMAYNIRVSETTQQIKANPAWRLRDPAGQWYCPFCARPTEISIPDNKLTRNVIETIIKHLDKCFAYDRGKGQPQTVQYLQTVIKNTERVKKLTPQVQQKMATEPLWQFRNDRHKWACPYCKRVLDSVDLSSELLVRSVAPKAVAKHLVESCPGFKEGAKPTATGEELSALTSSAPKKAAVVSRAPEEHDSTVFQAIRAELNEVRSALTEARQADESQKEVMRSLQKAGKHQHQMLPDLPQLPGFEFHVLYRPMSTVSGDFYDFFSPSENKIGIVVGDVSGHGMEAALVMSMVKKCLKIHGRGQSSSAETMRVTNTDVYEDLAQGVFASIFYGVLDVERKVLKFSRAGHSPLVLFNPGRKPTLSALEPKGIAVGIDKGPVFNRTLEEMEVQLASGDMLVQFTDGIVEAVNRKKEEFGTERLYATIQQYGTHEAKYLTHMIDLTLKDFTGEAPVEDDVTIMCIKVD